jgi:hypothetical protein
MASGLIVYLLLAAILWLMWRQVRGKSFADLLDQDLDLHHQVHRVIARHPKGGTWPQHRSWMRTPR